MYPNGDLRLRFSTSSPNQGDEAFVIRALEELVRGGFAFYEGDVEFVPVLRLLSGEIFMLGANWTTRIK
jgi:hypothetical protein